MGVQSLGETFLIARLTLLLWSYLGPCGRWLFKFARLLAYTCLLLPGFTQVPHPLPASYTHQYNAWLVSCDVAGLSLCLEVQAQDHCPMARSLTRAADYGNAQASNPRQLCLIDLVALNGSPRILSSCRISTSLQITRCVRELR